MKNLPKLKVILWTGVFASFGIPMFLLIRQSKQISLESVLNANFSDLYSSEIQSQNVIFQYGQYQKSTDIFPQLSIGMPFAAGDINRDSLVDYAIIVLHEYSQRTARDCDLVLVINQDEKPIPVQRLPIKICNPTRLEIRQNYIILENNSFEYTKNKYQFKNGLLTEEK